MTSSPVPKPESAATPPQVRREGAKPARDRDWPLILGILGFVLTLFSIVVMGFFHLEGRIDGLETSMGGRMDALTVRIDALAGRMDALEASLGGRIDALTVRMDALAARMDTLETSLGGRIDALAARMDALETSMGSRIDGLYELLLSLKR